MFLDPLDPNSPLFMVLRHWVPTLIPIVIGGYFASILFPRWQAANVKAKAVTEHRLTLMEDLAIGLVRYHTAWRRLLQIARYAETNPLSDVEAERRDGFVEERNEARDALMDLCARGQLYFSQAACDLISDFVAWDEAQTAKTLADLPPLQEWRSWENKILSQLRRDEEASGSSRR